MTKGGTGHYGRRSLDDPFRRRSRNDNHHQTMRTATMLVTDAELALALTSSSFTPSTTPAAATATATLHSSSSSPDDGNSNHNDKEEAGSSCSSPSLSGISGSIGQGGLGRFGTVYVGCRRVRPSSRLVRDALRERKKMKKKDHVEEKTCEQVVPSENDAAVEEEEEEDERTQSKKRPRRTSGRSVDEQENEQGGGRTGEPPQEVANGNDEMHQDEEGCNDDGGVGDDDDEYYRFPTAGGEPSVLLSLAASSSRLVKEEVADLAGEREGVPPVALPYSMMRLAVPFLAVREGNLVRVPITMVAVFDVELSQLWAQLLKDSMRAAEELRDSEPNVRKMPYVLEPELWSRKRPLTMLTTTTSTTGDGNGREETIVPTATSSFTPSPGSWFACQYDTADQSIRDVQQQYQVHEQQQLRTEMEEAIVQCLHKHTHLHVSCGAKFGCDYLLYEGSRHHYHAFAGVRVIVPPRQTKVPSQTDVNQAGMDDNVTCEDPGLPIPTPYDMAGYVRGLNTAGKLALLATAVKDDSRCGSNNDGGANADVTPRYRVAMVDLALKKVRATTFKGASGTVTPKMLPKRPVGPVGARDNQS